LSYISRFMSKSAEAVHIDNEKKKHAEKDSKAKEAHVVGPFFQYVNMFSTSLVGTKLTSDIDFKGTLHNLIVIAHSLEPEDLCFYDLVQLIFAFIMCTGENTFPVQRWDKLTDNSILLLEALNYSGRVVPTANLTDFLLNILTQVPAKTALSNYRSALSLCERAFFSCCGKDGIEKEKCLSFINQFLRDADMDVVRAFISFNLKGFANDASLRDEYYDMACAIASEKGINTKEDPSFVYPADEVPQWREAICNGFYGNGFILPCGLISSFGIPVASPQDLKRTAEVLLTNAIISFRRFACMSCVDIHDLPTATEDDLTLQESFLKEINSEHVTNALSRLAKVIVKGDTSNEKDSLASVLVDGLTVGTPENEPKSVFNLGLMTVFDPLVREAANTGVVGTKKKIDMLLLYSAIASKKEETEKMLLELFAAAGLCSETPSDDKMTCCPSLFRQLCFSCTGPLLPAFVEQGFRKAFVSYVPDSDTRNFLPLVLGLFTNPQITEWKKVRVSQRLHIFCASEEMHKAITQALKQNAENTNELASWVTEDGVALESEGFSVERFFVWVSSFTSE